VDLPTKVDCSARDADGFHLAESDQGFLVPGLLSVAHLRPGKGVCRVARGDVDGAEDPRSKVRSLKGRNSREQRPAAVGNERRRERIRRRIKASKWVKLAGRHELVVSALKRPGRRPVFHWPEERELQSCWGIQATRSETAVRIQKVVSVKTRASVKPAVLGS